MGIQRKLRVVYLVAEAAYTAWPRGVIAIITFVLLQDLVGTIGLAIGLERLVVSLNTGGHVVTLFWAIIIALAAILPAVVAVALEKLQIVMEEKCEQEVNVRIMNALYSPGGVEHITAPLYSDMIQMVKNNAHLPANLFLTMAAWLGSGAVIAISLGLLWNVYPSLAVMVLVATPIGLLHSVAERRSLQATWDALSEDRRSEEYLSFGRSQTGFKEMKMWSSYRWLIDKYVNMRESVLDRVNMEKKFHIKIAVMTGTLEGIVLASGIVLVLWLSASTRIDAAQTVLALTLYSATLRQTQSLVSRSARVIQMSAMGGNLYSLLHYRSPVDDAVHAVDVPRVLRYGIRFQEVSFTYPGSRIAVLHDINCFLPAGKTVLIIGANGSGKSTFVSLLARLFDPQSGRITVDGKELRSLRLDDWRRRCSIAVQEFTRYEFTLREAIGIGGNLAVDEDEAIIAASDRVVGRGFISSFRNGLETRLGSQFPGGQDLSGGQWQKVALARTGMRRNPLVTILDEPSASLDVTSEQELISRLRNLAEVNAELGGVVVVVSHRLSLAEIADCILVFDGGRVVENGTPEELWQLRGEYYTLVTLRDQ